MMCESMMAFRNNGANFRFLAEYVDLDKIKKKP